MVWEASKVELDTAVDGSEEVVVSDLTTEVEGAMVVKLETELDEAKVWVWSRVDHHFGSVVGQYVVVEV